MLVVVNETDAEQLLDQVIKPIAYNNTRSYPYNELDDRVFEILLYSLFKEEITKRSYKGVFDSVSLMQGVGEEGRDCALYYKGASVGIIQCKKKVSRLSKPEVIKEIVKFLLYYILNKGLITDINNFTYYFTVSTGFSGPAIDLLDDFGNLIQKESKLESYVNEVIEKYETFKNAHLKYIDIKEELLKILKTIQVKKIIPEDLDQKLSDNDRLISRFFSVRMVIDVEELAKLREEYERDKMRLPDVLSHIYEHINTLDHIRSPEIKNKLIQKAEEILSQLDELGEENFIKFIKAMKVPFLPSFSDKAKFSFERNLNLITDMIIKVILISLIYPDLNFSNDKGQSLVISNDKRISLVFSEGYEEYNYVILQLLKHLNKSSGDISKIKVVVAGNSVPKYCIPGEQGVEIDYDYIIGEILDVNEGDKEVFTAIREKFNFIYHCQNGLSFRGLLSYEELERNLKMSVGGGDID